ncbi:MAG: flavin reductase family protein [Candidatus Omnitrophica bacterium]|nr:flavin reductase family protein [Candidatus Omnitrophota bacterium]
MAKREFPPSEALYPVPVILVSCTDKAAKKTNIITLAWCGVVCSKPPMLGLSIRPSRLSHRLIRETRDFVVNIPSVKLLKETDLCGVISGKDIDKFEACSFTERASSKISSSMIVECPVNIECVLKDIIKLGTHDLFLGEVVAVHADDGILKPDGSIDYEKALPFVYTQGEYRELGRKVGLYGFSKKDE